MYFNTSTQDDDMDVTWDWSSPRSKQNLRPQLKRVNNPSQSPKLTLKRHPSNNQIPKFDQIKQEIEALQSGIAFANNKIIKDENTNSPNKNQNYFDDFDDETIDEQLLLCSQLVEQEVKTTCTNVSKLPSNSVTHKETSENDFGTPKKHIHHSESTSQIKN